MEANALEIVYDLEQYTEKRITIFSETAEKILVNVPQSDKEFLFKILAENNLS